MNKKMVIDNEDGIGFVEMFHKSMLESQRYLYDDAKQVSDLSRYDTPGEVVKKSMSKHEHGLSL